MGKILAGVKTIIYQVYILVVSVLRGFDPLAYILVE